MERQVKVGVKVEKPNNTIPSGGAVGGSLGLRIK